MIKELQRVALTRPLPEYNLETGDVGTIVMVYERGKGYSVEFMSLTGKTVAIVTVDAAFVRPLKDRKLTNAREMAPA